MRAFVYVSIWLLLAAMLAACTGTSTRPLRLELPLLKLSPESFNGSVSLVQRLTFARHGTKTKQDQVIEAMLEIDASEVRLAGFALGQRILTLNWDGHVLNSERHPRLPEIVDAERVLRDVQFVYWPAASIRSVLPQAWSLDDEAGMRTLRHEGIPVLIVHYSAEPRWNARAELDNRLEGYRLSIESVAQSGGEQ